MKRSLACAVAVATALLTVPAMAQAEEGDAFRSVPLPFFWPRAELNDVAADGSGVWIGGAQGAYCVPVITHCGLYSSGNPVVRRWNGTAWKEYPLRNWSGQGQIGEVVSSGGETWIGGGSIGNAGFHDYLARFDGTAFQQVEKPSDESISMISTGPAGTWVAQVSNTAPRLQKRTGATWTGVPLPGGMVGVNDLQARTATDAWVVGWRSGEPGAYHQPAVARYDGTSWTSVAPPPVPADVSDQFVKVVPVGPEDVWALTERYLTHWNGDGWSLIPLPDGMRQAGDLAVDGSGTPWITAADWEAAAPLRYSGGVWHRSTIPEGLRMHDITAVPGTSTIWGVAHKGNQSDPVFLTNS